MLATESLRRSSGRWDTLFKADYPRVIDRSISYFGELPSSPRTSGPLPDVEGHAPDTGLGARAIGL